MLIPKRNLSVSSTRRGFTLVELMVTIVITMIMMFIFARVFAMTTGSMIRMHAIGENDERARTLTTILKEDLKSRTFRNVIPFSTSEFTTLDAPLAERRGYIYVSDNDISLDNDDVLQFTVDLSSNVDNTSGTIFYGKAAEINPDSGAAGPHYNQPFLDDSFPETVTTNGIGSSGIAELSYFLRNGNLYRRVLLLRQPIVGNDFQPAEGTDGNGTVLMASGYTATTNDQDPVTAIDGSTPVSDFWQDFDYSAYYNGTTTIFNGEVLSGPSSLDNSSGTALGKPFTRFGFNHTQTNAIPREYIGASNDLFIGRFTHQETSHSSFGYPGRIPTIGVDGIAGSPLDQTVALNDASPINGVVDEFEDTTIAPESRRGQDVILTNVLSFDVKLWDEGLQQFVDVGHSIAGGLLNNSAANSGPSSGYGPQGSSTNIFDTWHYNFDFDGDTTSDEPPYRPLDPSDGVTPIPVRAIKIIVRYYDTRSQSTRQLTIEQSLID